MAFTLRDLDGALAVFSDTHPAPIEHLGALDAPDTARARYWIDLGAAVDPATAAALRARAPEVFDPLPEQPAPIEIAHDHDDCADPDQGQDGRKVRAGEAPAELIRLLRYHQIDYDLFAPHEERFYDGLSALLAHHDIIGADELVDATTFEEAVRDYQRKAGLSVDGLPGRDTLWAMQKPWALDRALDTVRVPADAWGDAYTRFTLREDVAERYEALYADVKRRGGRITSAGSFRALSAEVTQGRSRTSIHYAGVALDMAPYSGLARIHDDDPYLVERDRNGRGWRVWCRSADGTSTALSPKTWTKGRLADADPTTCDVFDISEVMRAHGFADIGPRKGYETTYGCLEWWHFQCEAVLTPFVSQFGIELLSLARYDEAFLKKTAAWAHARNVFKSRNRGWH
ncbi:MAG: peptidoglycan-binding domain-containing protein [bacterium]